jgi:molecular chaperone HscB
MDLTGDFFTLFQLLPRFRLELTELEARYLALQGETHPDRFAAEGEAKKRLSMQWAAQINEGYRVLKTPLARAEYLLHLAGHDLKAENNTGMDADFLMAQMEWREAASEARRDGNLHELERLRQRLGQDLQGHYAELAALLDDRRDLKTAAEKIRRLMFLEKLRSEIDDALAFLDDDGVHD